MGPLWDNKDKCWWWSVRVNHGQEVLARVEGCQLVETGAEKSVDERKCGCWLVDVLCGKCGE